MKKLFAYSFLILATCALAVAPFVARAQTVSLTEYQPDSAINNSALKVPGQQSDTNYFYAFVSHEIRNADMGITYLQGGGLNYNYTSQFYARDVRSADGSITRVHFYKGLDINNAADDIAVASQTFDSGGKLSKLYVARGLAVQQQNSQNKVTFANSANSSFLDQTSAKAGNANLAVEVQKQQDAARDNPTSVARRTSSSIVDMYCRSQNGSITPNGYSKAYQAYIAENNLPNDNDCQSYTKYINDVFDRMNNNPLALTADERKQLIADGVLKADGTTYDNPANSRANVTAKAVNDEAAINAPKAKISMVGLNLCIPDFSIVPGNPTFSWNLHGCVAALANTAIEIVGIPFQYTAALLDLVTKETLTEFSKNFAKDGRLYKPVNDVWQLLKNICNLFFICALIFIAIKTIWHADGFQERKKLIAVIVCAVLINFSMFFTKLLIDVSNTATVQVFNVIVSSKSADKAPDRSLASVFLANMQVQKFISAGQTGSGGINYESLDYGYIITYALMSVIFLLVATVVIGVIAGMMIVRFIMLVVLLMTSPLAFIGGFTPKAIGSYSELWRRKLQDNLIFLPVLMLMFYITMTFATFASETISDPKNINSYAYLIFNYAITIVMLVASIAVAKTAGGSAGVAAWGGGLSKSIIGGGTFGLAARAGRRTLGLAGSTVANSNTLKEIAHSRIPGLNTFAKGTIKRGEKVAGSTFDLRNTSAGKAIGLDKGLKDGYEKGVKGVKEADAKARIAFAKEQTEKSGKDKADEEVAKQHKRALDNYEDNDKAINGYKSTIDSVNTKITNASDDIQAEIDKEKDKIEESLLETQKELREIEKAILADPSKRSALQAEKDRREKRQTELTKKLANVGADKGARVAEHERKLRVELKVAEDSIKAHQDSASKLAQDLEHANQIVEGYGYSNAAELRDKVKTADAKYEKKKKEYIAHLENVSNEKFFGFDTIEGKEHKKELTKELGKMFAKKKDEELNKALKLIREEAKEEEKKTA